MNHDATRNVLIVDDDPDLLLMSREGLENYAEAFTVLTAEDGESAVEELRRNPVSLVLTDLYMPRMDGFGLLAHISEHYPDIPVIVMTGYGTPKLEKQAGRNGAVAYIQKPFMIEDLARQMRAAWRRESDGGALHGFSIGTFAQLIEAEEKTCTIRVTDRESGEKGVLYFRNGVLLDARINGLPGTEAAYVILSWEDVSFSIQNNCRMGEKRIPGDLQAILLEAMRRKDEARGQADHLQE
jgi:CheY-like chemotaxis protein